MCITPNGKYAYSVACNENLEDFTYDNVFRVFNVETGEKINKFIDYRNKCNVTDMGAAPDGAKLIALTADGCVKLWDSFTGETLNTSDEPQGAPCSVRIEQKGKYAIYTTRNGIIAYMDMTKKYRAGGTRLWESHDGVGVGTILDDYSAVFATDSGYVGIGTLDYEEPTKSFLGRECKVKYVNLLRDPKKAVVATLDRKLMLWDIKKMVFLCSFFGEGRFSACPLSSASNRIIAADEAGALYFLEITGGQ
jgi:WD40 repeat protein